MKILERLWGTNSLRLSVLVPLILVLILLLGSMIFFLRQSQQKGLERELATTTKAVESLFLEYKEEETKKLSLSLSTLVLNKELLSAFKARDRDRLYGLTKSYYERLRSHYHITHLHFTGPDRVNILCLHQPDHGGERIDSVTMKEAEKSGREAQGIELGHLGTFTLLVVSPWYDGEQLLGYVELGMEIEHMLKELQAILGSRVYAFTYKDFIQREKWEAGVRMLGRKEKWDHFPDSVIIGEPSGQILEGVAQIIAGKHPLQSATDVHSDGKYYRVAFVPLIDATQRKIGHFAVLLDMTAKISAFQRSVLLICLFYAFVGTVLCLFFYAFLGRVEREQKRLEESRLEFEQRFKFIFDSANDGILLADTETKKFSLANKAMSSMLGYGLEEISTLGVADIHPQEDLPRIMDQFERLTREEIVLAENLPVKRKDESVFYVSPLEE
jgi:PAS domain S-box-containing protein